MLWTLVLSRGFASTLCSWSGWSANCSQAIWRWCDSTPADPFTGLSDKN